MEKAAKQKACPECGSTKLVRDYERAELVCAGCGFVIHDRIMDMGPEWRAFDQEQRDRRGRVGAPMTLSVDYEEPLIIERDGKIEILSIGNFVDKLLMESAAEVKKDGVLEFLDISELKYRAVAFNKDYKIDFRPITHVYRHEIQENLYRVELECGRNIRVTGAHSLYGVNGDSEIIPLKVSELKEGDFVIAPAWIPTPAHEAKELNLIDEFLKLPAEDTERFYLRHVPTQAYDMVSNNGSSKQTIRSWRRYHILPLSLAKKSFINNGSNLTITAHYGKNEIPTEIDVNKDLCTLLGYYVSRGSVTSQGEVIFSFGGHEAALAEEVRRIIRSVFGLEAGIHRANQSSSALGVSIHCEALGMLISKILGAGKNAQNKRVPPIIFSLPLEFKLAFLHAYILGDGCAYAKDERKDHWRPITQLYKTSVSNALSVDIMTLYSQLGIHANYREEEIPEHMIKQTGQLVKKSLSTGTRVTNPNSAEILGFIDNVPKRRRKGAIEDLVPTPFKYRKVWKSRKRIRINRDLAAATARKFNDKKLLKLAAAPFVFLRVKKIERVEPTCKYVYDISIPECENFAIAGGCICSNTIHDKGLSTMIDWRDRDSHGKDLTPKRRAQIYRLRKWQRRIRVSDATERNLAFALSEIDRMASHLALPRNVREAASLIYRKAVEERLIRGRSIEGVAAAALYAACRECKVPRTLDEIADVSRVSKKEIGRSYRFIARELLIHLRPTSPTDYIPRFGSELGLSGEVQSKAIELLKEATKKGLTSGRGPTGVAAAAIYIASVLCGERRTQRDVADVARVTEVTVRNRYKELCEKLGLDVEL